MDLIRPIELEKLLRLLPDIKTAITNIKGHLQALQGSTSEIIEALSLKVYNFDSVPSSRNQPNDRTLKIAATYEKLMSQEASELRADLLILEIVRDKLEIAIHTLNPLQQDFLKKRYHQGLTMEQLSDRMYISRSSALKKKKEALDRLRIISRISITEYELCMKILL